jgi:hypothetical protein
MKEHRYRYGRLALGLVLGGGLFALASWYIIGYMPLVALGVSGVILGASAFAIGDSLPNISADASRMLLRAGSDNIAALVEELGLHTTALYLPTFLTQGQPRALVPLHRDFGPLVMEKHLPQRLIVSFGAGPRDYGVLVSTLGSAALATAEIPANGSPGDIETALSALLVGALGLAYGVRVERRGEYFTVKVARPSLHRRRHLADDVLGSPLASIVAALVAESVGQPVSISGESSQGRWHVIKLDLRSRGEQ